MNGNQSAYLPLLGLTQISSDYVNTDSFTADTITGTTGTFSYLSSNIIYGSTGSFGYITGSTGTFNNVIAQTGLYVDGTFAANSSTDTVTVWLDNAEDTSYFSVGIPAYQTFIVNSNGSVLLSSYTNLANAFSIENENDDVVLNVNTITGGISGGTAYFDNLSGGTAQFQYLVGLTGIVGNTGTFTFLDVTGYSQLQGGVSGTTGSFTSLVASLGMSGPTGSFVYMSAVEALCGGITAGTGTFNGLLSAAGGITGGTGSFSYLNVADNALFNYTVQIDNQFNLYGTAYLNEDLNVEGQASFSNTVNISGELTVNNNLSVEDNISAGGTLSVTGNSTFSGTISGQSGAFSYIAVSDGITGATASFSYISGSTGSITEISGSTADYSYVVGSTGYFAGITGGTASFSTVIASIGISGPTGDFGYITGNTGNIASIDGTTASFSYVTASVGISGPTGDFGYISGNTGNIAAIDGTTASFSYVTASVGISGPTGDFGYVTGNTGNIASIAGTTANYSYHVGSTGEFTSGVTAATGSFQNVAIADNLTVSGITKGNTGEFSILTATTFFGNNQIANKMIDLYDNGSLADPTYSNFNGFGIQNNVLLYNVSSSSDSHLFTYGTATTEFETIFTIAGSKEVTTANNTLDNGSGNLTAAGTITAPTGYFSGGVSGGTARFNYILGSTATFSYINGESAADFGATGPTGPTGDVYQTTSTTSIAIPSVGNTVDFTIAEGLAYSLNQDVMVSYSVSDY